MKYQILSAVILICAILTGTFAIKEIVYYFTPKDAVIGNENSQDVQIYANLDNIKETPVDSLSRVLGAEINTITPNDSIQYYSYQGYVLDRYFASYNSPLTGYGEEFIKACIRYSTPTDCSLLPAIGKVETALCKTDISAKQHNCWGFGGAGPNRIVYQSFPEAIDKVTRAIKVGYGDIFFKDPNIGMSAYCGQHCTDWGNNVRAEQLRINQFFIQNGYPSLF